LLIPCILLESVVAIRTLLLRWDQPPGHQAHLRLARAQEVAGERARGDCNAQKGCSEAGPVITRIQEADAATCVRIQELGTQPMRRGLSYMHMLQARLLHVFCLWLKRRASARENMQNSATMPRHEPEARRTGARRTGARIDAKLKTDFAARRRAQDAPCGGGGGGGNSCTLTCKGGGQKSPHGPRDWEGRAERIRLFIAWLALHVLSHTRRPPHSACNLERRAFSEQLCSLKALDPNAGCQLV
jgi:hypothetical protein